MNACSPIFNTVIRYSNSSNFPVYEYIIKMKIPGSLRILYILRYPPQSGHPDVPPTTPNGKNPAKIGARNSSFASFDLGVGVRLQEQFLQPDAKARSRGRNIRITRADFRWVFSCSGWVSYRPHRKRDELLLFKMSARIPFVQTSPQQARNKHAPTGGYLSRKSSGMDARSHI